MQRVVLPHTIRVYFLIDLIRLLWPNEIFFYFTFTIILSLTALTRIFKVISFEGLNACISRFLKQTHVI